MASALDNVMNQAAAAADSFQATALQAAPSGGALQAAAPVKMTLDDMADNSGMQVDAYLQVKDAGLRIEGSAYFQTADVTINIPDVAVIQSVRANRGGATTFIKSYDGVSTSTGENFAQATANLRATHDKVDGPYLTAEIPVVLLQDVPGAKAGQSLGITPAITGVKFWTKFYKEVRDAGLQGGVVKAKISCVPQKNKAGNEWGVVGFELVGAA